MTSLRRAALCLTLLALGLAICASASGVASLRPLQTAIVDPDAFSGPDADLELGRAADAGASVIKVPLFWDSVAPSTRPAGFTPANPSDPAYDWSAMDIELRLVRSHGLTPLVYVSSAPGWAIHPLDGIARPDPSQLRAFTLAAVKRYSGATADLPRVRYWEAWNEPNKVGGPEYKASARAVVPRDRERVRRERAHAGRGTSSSRAGSRRSGSRPSSRRSRSCAASSA